MMHPYQRSVGIGGWRSAGPRWVAACAGTLALFALLPSGAAMSLELRFLEPAERATIAGGKSVVIRCSLADGGKPVGAESGAFVTAVLTYPDGKTEDIVRLRDDGRLGDARAGDGVWTGRLMAGAPDTAGTFSLRAKARLGDQEVWTHGVRSFVWSPAHPFPYTPLLVGESIALLLVLAWAVSARSAEAKPTLRDALTATNEPVVTTATPENAGSADFGKLAALRRECERLRTESESAAAQARSDQQLATFQTLSNLLVQLPSVKRAVLDGGD